jgi:hypothetical protein
MRFSVKDLGPERWFMRGYTKNAEEDQAFHTWMTANCSDCLFLNRFNSGDPYWEIRGGDKKLQTLILLKWQGDK